MTKFQMILMSLIVFIALALGYSLARPKSDAVPKTSIIRSYEVPEGQVEEIRNGLNRLFERNNAGEAGASAQAFGNSILVRAPEGFHGGIGDLLKSLPQRKMSERKNYRLDYWIVAGEVSAQSNEDEFPHLKSVLASVKTFDGNRKFRIIEHIGSNSLSGQENEIKGAEARVKTMARVHENTIQLLIDISSSYGQIKSAADLKSDEFRVLGENAMPSKENGFTEKTNVYHILRAVIL